MLCSPLSAAWTMLGVSAVARSSRTVAELAYCLPPENRLVWMKTSTRDVTRNHWASSVQI
ncbi:MAG TPA: hypothetical protein PLF25_01485 [Accumulibacter sp.]|nr:hypothetical protein [Accumulibacter sp.]